MSGTGLFRRVNTPIPTNQSQNYINNLHIANSFSGLHLKMPLGVRNILRLRSNIHNGENLLTLGDSTSEGTLITMPLDNWNLYGKLQFDTLQSLQSYDGGFINGVLKKWFTGNTNKIYKGIFPIGDSIAAHPMSLKFQNTSAGSVTALFKDSLPSYIGLPLFDEQNSNILNVSPTGYWSTSAEDVTGKYSIAVDASGFTDDEIHLIQDLSTVRLIRSDGSATWELSESETITGPENLNFIQSDSLILFGDFGIGNGNCKYVINGNDSGFGSLRFAIDSCSSNGDTIYFMNTIDSVNIISDTVVIDKNLTLDFNHNRSLLIDGHLNDLVFYIKSGVTVVFNNFIVKAGYSNLGSGIYNEGNIILNNVGIIRVNGSNEIYNLGSIEVMGRILSDCTSLIFI